MWVCKMGSVAVMTPDMTNQPHEEPKMTASQLANRVSLSQLIEFDMEAAQPEQLPPPPAVVYVHADDVDPDLLAGDDYLDLLQADEEEAFFSQMQMNRGHRAARRSFQNW